MTTDAKAEKQKKRAKKPARHEKHPEPAPEGRQRPHHDGSDADPLAHPEHRGQGRECFDPHLTEEDSGRVSSLG